MEIYLTLVFSPLSNVDLYYSSERIFLIADLMKNNKNGYSYGAQYDIETGKIEVNYEGRLKHKEAFDPEDMLEKFIRENKEKISEYNSILSRKQKCLVRRFLDELENNPLGLSGFLEA